jgi:hypothetical protein
VAVLKKKPGGAAETVVNDWRVIMLQSRENRVETAFDELPLFFVFPKRFYPPFANGIKSKTGPLPRNGL